ncbi:thioesterase family protein [Actinomycetospora sp. TBRC 11914]|uniref:acyl-CoA thioesterase n=1 Tax=Actinomycetospora sp. TBRC 11914 TaxID=2729387 RepID=UPI00145EBD27|nr:thioesterase family protein [Actinomycetospora sp. TBRC 11914]NMO89129.1 acyl-CoA thioesterase [Actinomycetospora sp. TBRC 11914]
MSTTTAEHSVTVVVRGYETDANGHLNHAVYHQYGEHGRTETLRAAGVGIAPLAAAGLGPVILETTVRFLAELRVGEEVEVVTEVRFGAGKSFRMNAEIRRGDTVAATLTGVMGMLDHATRRLVADPRGRLREHSADPAAFDRICGAPLQEPAGS